MADRLKLSLTYFELVELLGGLRGLGSYQRIIKDGERERQVMDFYKFGEGFKDAIVDNTTAVRAVAKAHEESEQRAREETVGPGRLADNDPDKDKKLAELQSRLMALMRKRYDVELIPFQESELNRDKNDIPAPILEALLPINATKRKRDEAAGRKSPTPTAEERATAAADRKLATAANAATADKLAEHINGKGKRRATA